MTNCTSTHWEFQINVPSSINIYIKYLENIIGSNAKKIFILFLYATLTSNSKKCCSFLNVKKVIPLLESLLNMDSHLSCDNANPIHDV